MTQLFDDEGELRVHTECGRLYVGGGERGLCSCKLGECLIGEESVLVFLDTSYLERQLQALSRSGRKVLLLNLKDRGVK